MSHSTSLSYLVVSEHEAFEDALGYLHDTITSRFGDDAIKVQAAAALGTLLLQYKLNPFLAETSDLEIPVIR